MKAKTISGSNERKIYVNSYKALFIKIFFSFVICYLDMSARNTHLY